MSRFNCLEGFLGRDLLQKGQRVDGSGASSKQNVKGSQEMSNDFRKKDEKNLPSDINKSSGVSSRIWESCSSSSSLLLATSDSESEAKSPSSKFLFFLLAKLASFLIALAFCFSFFSFLASILAWRLDLAICSSRVKGSGEGVLEGGGVGERSLTTFGGLETFDDFVGDEFDFFLSLVDLVGIVSVI